MSVLFQYQTVELLHAGARSMVYRARSLLDDAALIVKVPNKDFPSFQEIARFKREYAIARRCRHPGVAHPIAQWQDGGRWTLIHEDIGGLALDALLRERIAAGLPASQLAIALEDFFDMALQLCAALEAVHGQGVIHKDINPSNLVWNSERRHLQLIDFGIACELPQETQGIVNPYALEGTLRYMAPEQTGRMNRMVDHRADFYSLGATFYELLTGQPPFTSVDAMGLVHCHIARSPDWSHPAFGNLPTPLLAIVQRLLEKDAEQRYQTLGGLKRDLESCRASARSPGTAPVPALGMSDRKAEFRISQKLHGRAREIETLLSAFARTCAGATEMLLVAGYSGIGKSAVVNEVHKPIVARRGLFLSGKFDQYRHDVPYAPLIQAFQGLIRQLLSEPDEQVRQWAGKLHATLGAGLGVMVELIPELALIVGTTEPVAALPPEQAQLRLNRVFLGLVEVFAGAAHPLVLFLDDLQWADAPTLRMIELWMSAREQGHLLVIGAYRDNEVHPGHPLMSLCDKLKQGGAELATVTLDVLAELDVGHVIADTLQAAPAECAPLTRLLYRKTAGNPFFVNQFLQAIHDAGQLHYRADQDRWDWDLAALEQAAYTDNVADLLVAKIRRLPPATQQLLHLAAAIGNRFQLDTLAVVTEHTPCRAQQVLWPALDAGLVQPLDEHYKYVDGAATETGVGYRFLHDRVQQAAYVIAAPDARPASHLRIGRLLLAHATPQLLEQQLFAIVEQLNAGAALIGTLDERLRLAGLNRRAGIKARRSAAFQATLDYMRAGLALLPADAWQQHADLWFDLQLGAAEAAYLCGQFAAAEAIYPLVQSRSTTALQRVRCIAVQAHQYQLQGRLLDAIAVLRDGLGRLGIDIPHDPAQLAAGIDELYADTERRCAGCDPATLLAADEVRDPATAAAMEMMQGLWMAAYYAGQQELCVVMVLSMTRLSLQHGNSDFTSVGYVGYAFLLALRSGDMARSYRFGSMAMTLARRRANLQTRTLTGLMFAAMINHWTQPLRSSDALYDEAFDWALELADFVQVGVVAAVRATERVILGHYLPDLLQLIERDLALMRANGQQAMADCCVAAAVQPIKCLMGQTARSDSYDDDTFSESAFLDAYASSRLYHAYFLQGKIRNAYLFDGADAEALAGQLEVVTQMMRGQAKVPETSFYAALIWIRALRRDPRRADAAAVLARVESLQASLAAWAGQGGDVGARSLLVDAELARYRHDLPLATRRYQQAIDAAGAGAYVNIQALGNELCAECWIEQGQQRVAVVYLHDALARYEQWGADGKVRQLRACHEALLGESVGRTVQYRLTSIAGGGTTPARMAMNAALDLVSLLKAAQALSNEIGLRNVLKRLIAIVRENSGAQVARVLLLEDGAYRLEADITGDTVSVLQARPVALDAASDPQFPLSLLRYVIRSGAEVIEDNIATSPRFAADAYVQKHRPKSVMCLPVRQAGKLNGILYLENNLAAASFTEERVEFLRILCAQAMISIAHARLHDSLEQRVAERTAQLADANRKLATLSVTDGLTGLANRRHFDDVLRSESLRAMRHRQPLAMIMIDVDHFKKYNDCYGHQAGDECLIQVARALQAGMQRASDLTARYGGEEFSVVLPNTNADGAGQLAEALRRSIEQLGIAHASAPSGIVTISVGIALFSGTGESSPDALVRVADRALYRAKDAGRNCVVLSQQAGQGAERA